MKYLKVNYVNKCIKNAILKSTKCDKDNNPLVIGDIICTYFDLTNQQMSETQINYIETLSHKQTCEIIKCLKFLTSKVNIKSVEEKYKLNEKKEVVEKINGIEHVYSNSKIITLENYDKAELYIKGYLKTKLSNWRAESMNLSFFNKPKFIKCSTKQIQYIENLIEEKFLYNLSDIQKRYLSKQSINNISSLISSLIEMDIVIKDKYNVGKTCLIQ